MTNSVDIVRKYDVRLKQTIEYYNISCAFDIETTSTYYNNRKVAFMYAWGFALNDETNYFTGRTWGEFLSIIDEIKQELKLSFTRRLVIYVHNLGYEFQFMRKYFEWSSVFSISDRKPIKAITVDGLEFRDSYILSGYSLENTAKNLTDHKIKKLVGDLDYKKIRHHKTPISDTEWGYIKNDVIIVLYYIQEQIKIYEKITKIPLTNTGRVREYVKHNCYYSKGKSTYKSSKGKYRNYRNLMSNLTISDETEYNRLKWAFMGGFTHSNAIETDKVINNVHSIDFTSSYPSVMLAEQYPMGQGFTITESEIKENGLQYYLDKYCCLITTTLYNVKNKFIYDSYLSESKCKIRGNKQINNGRIYQADLLTTVITEQDWWIIDKVYNFDYVINELRVYPKGYLPKQIILSILELYKKKTELKGVDGQEVEYLLSKGMLNSVYGMTVTDIVKDEITYTNDDEWGVQEVDTTTEIENYNLKKSRFLFYPWGVWVTAYARKNLWTGIFAMGKDYIYSDTDSIKFINYDKHLEFIELYNKIVEEKQRIALEYYNIDTELLYPKTIKGKTKIPGVWDYEGKYSRFKTLGAKRYLVEQDNKLTLTCAGLSKQNGINYLLEQAGNDNTKVFDMFNDEMTIPADSTGKNTHTYIDNEYQFAITDYTGNKADIVTKSGIHLEETGFTLSISKNYYQFLDDLKNGYLYLGDIKL